MMLKSGFNTEDFNYALPEFRKVYPSPRDKPLKGHHANDVALFRKTYKKKAIEIGEAKYKSMQSVLSFYRYRYLKGPESQKNITQLAYSIRAWLPFVAYSPFLTLKTRPDEDYNDERYWKDNVPNGFSPPDISNVSKHADFFDKYVKPDPIARTINPKSAKRQRELVRKSIIAEHVKRNYYVSWREAPTSQRDPRMLSMQSMARLFGGNSDQFRQFIYDRDPILLLLSHVTTPRQLEDILNKDPHPRDEALRKLVRKATDKLKPTADAFKRDLAKRPIPWDRYKPLLCVAKNVLFPMPIKNGLNYEKKKTQAMHDLMNNFDRKLSPWTFEDTLNWMAIAASIGLTLLTVGTSLPLTVATVSAVSIDVGLVGWNTYQNHLENLERRKLNSFDHVDAALKIASPEMDLSNEALFLGVSYLAGPFLGVSVRSVKKVGGRVLKKRAAKRAIEKVPHESGHTAISTATATRRTTGSTRATNTTQKTVDSRGLETATASGTNKNRQVLNRAESGTLSKSTTSGSTRATNTTQKTVDSRGLETATASGTIQNRQVLNQAESGYLSRSTLPIPGETLLLPNGQPPNRLVVGGTVETLIKEASGNQKAIEGIKQLEPGDVIMNTDKSAGRLPDYMGSVHANIENLEDILRATNRQMIEVDEVYIQRIGFFGNKGKSITNPFAAFKNCALFLKPGGKIMIRTGSESMRKIEKIRQALKKAGFKDIVVIRPEPKKVGAPRPKEKWPVEIEAVLQ